MNPVTTQTLVADRMTPVAAYAALRRAYAGASFLLESVVSGERWGRYSILGYRPRRDIVVGAPGSLTSASGVDPFSELAACLGGPAPPERELAARFARAHVGYLAYD